VFRRDLAGLEGPVIAPLLLDAVGWSRRVGALMSEMLVLEAVGSNETGI